MNPTLLEFSLCLLIYLNVNICYQICWFIDNVMLFYMIYFIICTSKIQFEPVKGYWLLFEALLYSTGLHSCV